MNNEKDITNAVVGILFLAVITGIGVAIVCHNLGWGLLGFVAMFLFGGWLISDAEKSA
jgi:hypothetical protein